MRKRTPLWWIILLALITIALPNGTFWEIASFFILVIASGIATCRWLRERHRNKERKAIREKLAVFIEEGRQIKGKCFDKNTEAPEDETNQWNEKVFNYLDANLGNDYAQRFQSHEGLPAGFTTLSGIQERIESYIGSRLARLNQFLAELTRLN